MKFGTVTPKWYQNKNESTIKERQTIDCDKHVGIPTYITVSINAGFRPGIAIRSVQANCTYEGTRELR